MILKELLNMFKELNEVMLSKEDVIVIWWMKSLKKFFLKKFKFL